MFRISNDVQRSKVKSDIEGFKRQRMKIGQSKGQEAARIFWKAYRPLVKQHEEQITRYDQLRKKSGNGSGLTAFKLSVDNLNVVEVVGSSVFCPEGICARLVSLRDVRRFLDLEGGEL